MPEQCSKAVFGKRGATFCIGVPCEKLVPKISWLPSAASSRNTRSASCGLKILSMTVVSTPVPNSSRMASTPRLCCLGPADFGNR